MSDINKARATAACLANEYSCPAYIYRRADNNELVICLVQKSETWLDRVPLVLVETVANRLPAR